MPYSNVPDDKQDAMEQCVAKVMKSGKDKQAAIAICYASIVDGKHEEAAKHGFVLDTNAFKVAVKVAGDWELDVLGNPYGPDSDRQYFDNRSEIVSGAEIPVVYYHGLDESGDGFTDKPIVIGKAINPEKRADGIWWRVILDKAKTEASRVWKAAKNGAAVASSGAIEYLSRLEIGGKLRQYDKRLPGRIAVWHMGELSLWESDSGKRRQAHPYAVAIPALKSVYKQAGIDMPDIPSENDEQEAREKAAKIAKKNLQKKARILITMYEE